MKGRPRVLFVPFGWRGLGHLSRACKLAEGIQTRARCLIATHHRVGAHLIPDACEYVETPGPGGSPDSRAAGQTSNMGTPENLVAQRKFFCDLERTFKPDLIVTDHFAAGPVGEFEPALSESRAVKFIVLRSVIGSSVAPNQTGREKLEKLYDGILVAGDRRIALVDEDLCLTPHETARRHYLGYVSIPVSPEEIKRARQARGLSDGDRWVVCSVGSGYYNRALIDDCLDLVRSFPDVRFDIVSGPSNPVRLDSSPRRGLADGQVRCATRRVDLRVAHAAADVVICHGGYNTLTEAMEGGAALIVDPRGDAHDERARHARRLQPHYPIRIAETPEDLARHLRDSLAGPERRSIRSSQALDFDGRSRFEQLVFRVAGLTLSAT